jgi:hypothetical protein
MSPDGLILFQKTYDLILEVHPVIVSKFPKNQRFVLGQKIENTLIAILEIVITINLSKPTVNYFRRLDIEIQKLKIFIRLAKDLKFISIKKYEYLEKKVIEVGKITGGWKKTLI